MISTVILISGVSCASPLFESFARGFPCLAVFAKFP